MPLRFDQPRVRWHMESNGHAIQSIDAHPSGRFVTAGRDGCFRVWKLRHNPRYLQFSHELLDINARIVDAKKIALERPETEMFLIELQQTRDEILMKCGPYYCVDFLGEFSTEYPINTIRFSPNGHFLVVATEEEQLQIWAYEGPGKLSQKSKFGVEDSIFGDFNVETWECVCKQKTESQPISADWSHDNMSIYYATFSGVVGCFALDNIFSHIGTKEQNSFALSLLDFPTVELANHSMPIAARTVPFKLYPSDQSESDRMALNSDFTAVSQLSDNQITCIKKAIIDVMAQTISLLEKNDIATGTINQKTPYESILSPTNQYTIPNPAAHSLYQLSYTDYCVVTQTPITDITGIVIDGARKSTFWKSIENSENQNSMSDLAEFNQNNYINTIINHIDITAMVNRYNITPQSLTSKIPRSLLIPAVSTNSTSNLTEDQQFAAMETAASKIFANTHTKPRQNDSLSDEVDAITPIEHKNKDGTVTTETPKQPLLQIYDGDDDSEDDGFGRITAQPEATITPQSTAPVPATKLTPAKQIKNLQKVDQATAVAWSPDEDEDPTQLHMPRDDIPLPIAYPPSNIIPFFKLQLHHIPYKHSVTGVYAQGLSVDPMGKYIVCLYNSPDITILRRVQHSLVANQQFSDLQHTDVTDGVADTTSTIVDTNELRNVFELHHHANSTPIPRNFNQIPVTTTTTAQPSFVYTNPADINAMVLELHNTPAQAQKNTHVQDFKLFVQDEGDTTYFYRRPDWSPDGLLLACPMGVYPASAPIPEKTDDVANITTIAQSGQQNENSRPLSEGIMCTHIFSRTNFTKPLISLPNPQNEASIVCRFSPVPFIQKDCLITIYSTIISSIFPENNKKSQKIKTSRASLTSTGYYYLLAVGTPTYIVIYRTDTFVPVISYQNPHSSPLTDCTWSSDGSRLIVTAWDGYCSFITINADAVNSEYVDPNLALNQIKNSKQLLNEPQKAEEYDPNADVVIDPVNHPLITIKQRYFTDCGIMLHGYLRFLYDFYISNIKKISSQVYHLNGLQAKIAQKMKTSQMGHQHHHYSSLIHDAYGAHTFIFQDVLQNIYKNFIFKEQSLFPQMFPLLPQMGEKIIDFEQFDDMIISELFGGFNLQVFDYEITSTQNTAVFTTLTEKVPKTDKFHASSSPSSAIAALAALEADADAELFTSPIKKRKTMSHPPTANTTTTTASVKHPNPYNAIKWLELEYKRLGKLPSKIAFNSVLVGTLAKTNHYYEQIAEKILNNEDISAVILTDPVDANDDDTVTRSNKRTKMNPKKIAADEDHIPITL